MSRLPGNYRVNLRGNYPVNLRGKVYRVKLRGKNVLLFLSGARTAQRFLRAFERPRGNRVRSRP